MKEFASNIWDARCGKPRAAASDNIKGLEDQDKIQIDKMDRIGDEGQSDAQNNDGTLVLWEHMFHEAYSFIFIRPVPLPSLIFIFHVSYFLIFLK